MKNKIFWKNLIWNYSTRLWHLWKYRHNPNKKFLTTKIIWTEKQKQKLLEEIKKSAEKYLQQSNQQPNLSKPQLMQPTP